MCNTSFIAFDNHVTFGYFRKYVKYAYAFYAAIKSHSFRLLREIMFRLIFFNVTKTIYMFFLNQYLRILKLFFRY